MRMKMTRILLTLAFGIIALSASAQDNQPAGQTTEQRMKELQMRGFGAHNTSAAQVGQMADSVAKAEEKQHNQQTQADTDPEFPGGEVFMQTYLKKKLLHSGVTGKGDVVISFRVDKKGNIYGAEITKSSGATLDTEAFNIVTRMPRWRPGLTKGEPADKPASVTVSFGKEE